jgi:hypothetical protein
MINDSLKFFISIQKSGCYTEAPLVLPLRVAVLPPSLFRLHVLVRDSLNHGWESIWYWFTMHRHVDLVHDHMDLVHHLFSLENNSEIWKIPGAYNFVEKPLYFILKMF